jgi:two-component system chemotaxis response regulator CheB
VSDDDIAPGAVVVIGASAGGVEALRTLVSGLPADFPATVLVVLHLPPTGHSALPAILDRAGPLPARHAQPGDELQPGHVLVAPPDHHLIVVDGEVTLSRGPTENGHRPAVDVLFRSAARVLGNRVVGVVLSGSLDDGASGIQAIRHRGGRGVVQDFGDALHDGMPRAAYAAGADLMATAAAMPAVLTELVHEPPAAQPDQPSELLEMETAMADLEPEAMHNLDRPGEPAGFGCPDCSGALFRIEDGGLLRFRCRVGHAWSPESLLAQQGSALESALWTALRALEEKIALSRDLAAKAEDRGDQRTSVRFGQNAEETLRAAELVRELVATMGARGLGAAAHEEVAAHGEG